ncbi:MAG: acetyltransferase, partial [Patescibacteria group bacterium]
IGAYVRIGVNASIMPGVKIGADSFIGAGISVPSDVPQESFVTGETKLTITKNKRTVRNASRERYKKEFSS